MISEVLTFSNPSFVVSTERRKIVSKKCKKKKNENVKPLNWLMGGVQMTRYFLIGPSNFFKTWKACRAEMGGLVAPPDQLVTCDPQLALVSSSLWPLLLGLGCIKSGTGGSLKGDNCIFS